MSPKKLVVVGGGAAGFFCAVNAARMNPLLEVIILEKSNKLLSKVKISGGGRCNVTNNCTDISAMSKNYPRGGHFMKKALHQFGPDDTVNWFAEKGIQLKTELDDKMFPVSDSSKTIIDCLLLEAKKNMVKINLSHEVKSILHQDRSFILEVNNGSVFTCDFVCIATGGYPKEAMFDWIKLTGHRIEFPVPSLFTFNSPESSIKELMGISLKNTRVKILGTKLVQEGPILITHWGLSGPVILKLSAWGAKILATCNYGFTAIINWIPEYNDEKIRNLFRGFRMTKGGQSIGSRTSVDIPQRLWKYLLQVSTIQPGKRWGEITVAEQNRLVKNLIAFEVMIKGKTTFKEEFVTCGGVHLAEVDPTTMMSRKRVNLFFAGEILDVDGITGGFNFQHAWTSGFIAGKNIASSF